MLLVNFNQEIKDIKKAKQEQSADQIQRENTLFMAGEQIQAQAINLLRTRDKTAVESGEQIYQNIPQYTSDSICHLPHRKQKRYLDMMREFMSLFM